MAIGEAKRNAKYRFTRSHVCKGSHGRAHDILIIIRGHRKFER